MVRKTSVGKEQIPIFREFIHEVGNKTKTLERHFHPIHFIPLQTHTMHELHFKLVNDAFQPVKIRDNKTVIVLHFRRVEWKVKTCNNKH